MKPNAGAGAVDPERGGEWAGRTAMAAGPFVVGFVLAIVLFHRVVVAGTDTFLGNWDASAQSFAWHAANADAVRHGSLKLWDFTTSSGTSFAGEMQTAPFYPVTWLFGALFPADAPDVLEWIIIFHFALGFGFFFHCSKAFGLSSLAAGCGALIFTFVGSVALRSSAQPNIFESLVYLPAVLCCVVRALADPAPLLRNPWIYLGGVATGMMILAGHMQPPIHAGLAAVVVAVFFPGSGSRPLLRVPLCLLGVAIVAAAFASPQLVATWEYMKLAYRWVGTNDPTRSPHTIPYAIYGFRYVLTVDHWPTLFNGGMAGAESSTLFFTQSGLVLGTLGVALRRRLSWLGVTLAALALCIALGDASVIGRLSYHVPFLGSVRQPVRILCLFHLGAALVVAVAVDHLWERLSSGRNWGRAGALAAVLLIGVEAARFDRQIIAPRTLPLYPGNYYSRGPACDLARLTRNTGGIPYRYQCQPNDLLPPNLGNVTAAFSTRGHRATMQVNYRDYLDHDWSPGGENLRRLGLRYVVAETPPPGFALIGGTERYRLFERADAVGIFYFLTSDAVVPVVLESIVWSHNSVALRLSPGQQGRLVFAQPWYPGWHIRCEGRNRPSAPAGSFLYVDVTPADREIVFYYRPAWLWPTALAALTALVIAAIALRHAFRQPHGPSP